MCVIYYLDTPVLWSFSRGLTCFVCDMYFWSLFQTYELKVQEMQQPLLVSRPKERDMRRGQEGPLLLVPELCTMTGTVSSHYCLGLGLAAAGESAQGARYEAGSGGASAARARALHHDRYSLFSLLSRVRVSGCW